VLYVIISENEQKLKATSSFLKQELQELQDKLQKRQLQENSEICALKSQLAACNDELIHQDARAKEKLKAEMKTFRGDSKYN